MKANAVILGLEGATSLGVIRSLGEKSVPCMGINITSQKGDAYYSKFLTNKWFSPNGYSEYELLKLLTEDRVFEGGVLFPTTDEMVLFIDKNASALKKRGLKFAGSKFGIAELINKDKMKEFAVSAGFKIPEIYSGIGSESIHFPILAKPRNSIGYTKKDFKKINSSDELDKFMQKEDFGSYILEDYIPGTDLNMVGVFACRNTRGKAFAPCMTKRIRQYPADIGVGSYIITFNDEKIRKAAEKLLEVMEYIGLADLDIKQNPEDGSFYFLEINYRAGAPAYISTSAGVNLPYIYYMDMLDNSYMEIAELSCEDLKCRSGVSWMQDEMDWKHLFKGVNLSGYIKDLVNTDCFAVFSFGDIRPALHMWIKKVKKILSGIIKFIQNIVRGSKQT